MMSVGVCVLVAAMTGAVASAQAAQSDEAAIRARIRAYAQATEKGVWAERAKFYTDDADVWVSTTKRLLVGKAALESELNRPSPPGMTFAIDVERVTIHSAEFAAVDAGYRAAVGDQKIAGYVFYVMVKRQGEWFVRSVRAVQIAPQ